ncbi:GNAT family N-acetyltransferase [Pseudoalteromonas sp. MMG005]|uniref:GNAT family N-acetyltransferase n=1 Tax=Pseudoalteromonas sp. MMG005 TaxID=2822682 RepID=UPI001B3A609F|nr:GNAT family N-acetyltransferase [Pseudoalteromonas sp. MMG005]MBQ4846319.1 GNAT family N-acetyltransferase [Pseudoalteromonas sp. MMG005]
MSKTLSMQRCNLDNSWDEFIQNSDHGTPFMQSSYIDGLTENINSFYCCKGDEKIAALLLIVDKSGDSVIGHPDIIHDGIIHRSTKHLNSAQAHSEQFSAQQFIAEYLAQKYHHVKLKLSPNIKDIRAFLWVNYHEREKPRFHVDVRYTSLLSIEELNKENIEYKESLLYKNSSVSRRQEIRYGHKKGVIVSKSKNYKNFCNLYTLTMQRQNIEFSLKDQERLYQFITALCDNNLILMFQAESASGQVGSYAVFLLYGSQAYYLYGANDPQMRNEHTGTMVLQESFISLAKSGIANIDLEGINSPQRGWFKLSFGGNVTPYYQLTLSP